MTARMYYDADADLSALEGQTVAVIGYGSQGHAHALNLRDSGVEVVVGLAQGSKSRALAEAAGFAVLDTADAVKAADVVMIAVPDTAQKAVYDADIAPNLRPGALLMFAHGFNIRFGRIQPAAGTDVGHGRAQGPGPPRALGLRAGRRRAGAVRGGAGRQRHRPGPDARLRPRHRQRPAPASSRPRSRRRPRPTCSASRRSSAAACPPSSRPRSRRSSRPATSRSSRTSRPCTSSS